MSFVRVCRIEEIAPGAARVLSDAPEPIAVFNVAGRFFATQDRCTHGQFSLSESYIEGDQVVCALHNGRFCIRTGKRLSPPVCRALRTFDVAVREGEVHVDIDSGAYVARDGAGANDGVG